MNLPTAIVPKPRFIYGTAWKSDDTARLTVLALRQGFRAIDTANQRKHYDEAAVGRGINHALRQGIVTRKALFIQTKFTFPRGQDHRMPYDPSAPVREQVAQSFTSSLTHLQVDRVESYLLHGPSTRSGLGADDWEAWRMMEDLHAQGLTQTLGVSNVTVEQLERLCDGATVPPAFVQNRCYARTGWDHTVRSFCREHGILYQGFSLLTANRALACEQRVRVMAAQHECTVNQLIFRFASDAEMIPLTGTSNADHMTEDLSLDHLRLSPCDMSTLESLLRRS